MESEGDFENVMNSLAAVLSDAESNWTAKVKALRTFQSMLDEASTTRVTEFSNFQSCFELFQGPLVKQVCHFKFTCEQTQI
jgi:hypothetical protein